MSTTDGYAAWSIRVDVYLISPQDSTTPYNKGVVTDDWIDRRTFVLATLDVVIDGILYSIGYGTATSI